MINCPRTAMAMCINRRHAAAGPPHATAGSPPPSIAAAATTAVHPATFATAPAHGVPSPPSCAVCHRGAALPRSPPRPLPAIAAVMRRVSAQNSTAFATAPTAIPAAIRHASTRVRELTRRSPPWRSPPRRDVRGVRHRGVPRPVRVLFANDGKASVLFVDDGKGVMHNRNLERKRFVLR